MFILDRDHIGIPRRADGESHELLARRIAARSQSDFHVTVVSFHEQILGWNAYIARAKEQTGILLTRLAREVM